MKINMNYFEYFKSIPSKRANLIIKNRSGAV